MSDPTEGPAPDLLQGWRDAGLWLTYVMGDAEKRLTLEGGAEVQSRFGDIRMHTQCKRDYADRAEKQAVMNAAEDVLNATLENRTKEGSDRFEEALQAMKVEEERVFVCIILGNIYHFVYWNWRYGYTMNARPKVEGATRFTRDVDRRRVASPELATVRYGSAVKRTADESTS